MFKEGSVFKALNKEQGLQIFGANKDIKPEILGNQSHPVWRCGRTFFINF